MEHTLGFNGFNIPIITKLEFKVIIVGANWNSGLSCDVKNCKKAFE